MAREISHKVHEMRSTLTSRPATSTKASPCTEFLTGFDNKEALNNHGKEVYGVYVPEIAAITGVSSILGQHGALEPETGFLCNREHVADSICKQAEIR